jgi:hypothetical protein
MHDFGDQIFKTVKSTSVAAAGFGVVAILACSAKAWLS